MNTSEAWLEERRKGVGGSECAAACGRDPWCTPLELYMRKTGLIPDKEQTAAMRRGLRFEQPIAEEWAETNGIEIERAAPMLRHPKHAWMFANLDFVVKNERRIVEVKMPGPRMASQWGEEGTDWVPEHYLLQVQHQMAVTGFNIAHVVVFLSRDDIRTYNVPRNQIIIDSLEEIEGKFWQRVVDRDPPEPDFKHPRTHDLARQIFGVDAMKEIILTDELAAAWQEISRLKFECKQREERIDELKSRLAFSMGDAVAGILPEGKRKIVRTMIPDSIGSQLDVDKAIADIGKVKRKGHVRWIERDVK